MDFPVPAKATIFTTQHGVDALVSGLTEAGTDIQQVGAARGVTDAATVLIAAVPSVAALALLLEKLRRLRLPRTYVVPGPDGVDIYHDEAVPDGRIVVVRQDGSVIELPDRAITVAALAELWQALPDLDD